MTLTFVSNPALHVEWHTDPTLSWSVQFCIAFFGRANGGHVYDATGPISYKALQIIIRSVEAMITATYPTKKAYKLIQNTSERK